MSATPLGGGKPGASLNLQDYARFIPLVQQELQDRGVRVPPWGATEEECSPFTYAVIRALADLNLVREAAERQRVGPALADWMLGLGILQHLIDQDGMEDIFVTGGHVSVIRHGVAEALGILAPDEYFHNLAVRVADLRRRTLRAASPFVLVTLPGGHRFAATIPPVSATGTAIAIRVFPRTPLSLVDLVPDPSLRAQLIEMVQSLRVSLLVSGQPGAGKTTFLSALTAHLPTWAQVRVVEKFAELRYQGPPALFHLVTMEEQEEAPVTMADLVDVVTTRTRPHLVVVGEIVSDEATNFLHAANLGVRAWGTIHGNSAYDALLRLEDLAAATGHLPLAAIQTRIARTIQVIVHLDMDLATGQRFIREIATVQGLQNGRYELKHLFNAGEL
jgi:pilus assembly protein CpaF